MATDKTGSSGDGAERRHQHKRRGLIAGTAVLSAALMARLSVREAAATDGVALITGQNNTSLGETRISRTGNAQVGSPPSSINAFTVTMDSTVGAAAVSAQALGSTVGVVGQSVNQIGTFGISGTNIGALGSSTDSYGVKGQSTNNAGVYGSSTAALPGIYGTGNGPGVQGESGTGGTIGVIGKSVTNYGVQGQSTNAAAVRGDSVSNIGVGGVGGTVGVQGQASGTGIGVYGINSSATGFAGRFDGEFIVNGGFTATGIKSAVVVASDGVSKRLYCMESPDSWFEDVGDAQLDSGSAGVALDSGFASVVNLNAPYIVFLTPNGDCNGLYVADRTDRGFSVKELRGGSSTVKFSYRILARRRDVEAVRLQHEDAGKTSSNGAQLLGPAPSAPVVPPPPPLPNLVNTRPIH